MLKAIQTLAINSLCVVIALLSCTVSNAQFNLDDKVAVDSNVMIGKLSNGLTYYIRQNKKPENK